MKHSADYNRLDPVVRSGIDRMAEHAERHPFRLIRNPISGLDVPAAYCPFCNQPFAPHTCNLPFSMQACPADSCQSAAYRTGRD